MIIISQKRDDIWLFRCYDLGGSSSYGGQYDALPIYVQTEIDSVLEILVATRTWPETLSKELRGSCYGLVEIIVELLGPDDQPEHYRLLGFYGPDKMEFTLLFIMKKETDSDYGPACRSALPRKDGVIKDGRRAPPCE
jgi:hypothetical protein